MAGPSGSPHCRPRNWALGAPPPRPSPARGRDPGRGAPAPPYPRVPCSAELLHPARSLHTAGPGLQGAPDPSQMCPRSPRVQGGYPETCTAAFPSFQGGPGGRGVLRTPAVSGRVGVGGAAEGLPWAPTAARPGSWLPSTPAGDPAVSVGDGLGTRDATGWPGGLVRLSAHGCQICSLPDSGRLKKAGSWVSWGSCLCRDRCPLVVEKSKALGHWPAPSGRLPHILCFGVLFYNVG